MMTTRRVRPMRRISNVIGTIVLLVLPAAAPAAAAVQRSTAGAPLVFDHVVVVDVERGRLVPDQRVVIKGSRIQAVGDVGKVNMPKGASVVDARGKYLIPGLWDMHVHPMCYPQTFYSLFIANGVTGLRDPGSTEPLDSLRRWRQEIADGQRIGPRQVFSGPYLSDTDMGVGRVCADLMSVTVTTPDDVRRAVDSLKAAGADFIKHRYNGPDARSMYFTIAAEARRAGMPLGGHIPDSVLPIEASDSGAVIIDHSGQWKECIGDSATIERCSAIAERLRRNGTWYVPTVTLFIANPLTLEARAAKRFWPDSVQQNQPFNFLMPRHDRTGSPARPDSGEWKGRLALMQQAGMPILASTDAAPFFLFQAPGFSLHDELATLVWMGLTPLASLQSATLNAAKALHATDSLGTVAPGKLADLVLLDADPLADINNTVRIRAVVTNGRYFDRTALDQLLADLEARAGP